MAWERKTKNESYFLGNNGRTTSSTLYNQPNKQPSAEVDKEATRHRNDPGSHVVASVWLGSFIVKVLPECLALLSCLSQSRTLFSCLQSNFHIHRSPPAILAYQCVKPNKLFSLLISPDGSTVFPLTLPPFNTQIFTLCFSFHLSDRF